MKNASNQYPRPQMIRGSYLLLDGEWECNGETVTVPYPPQSPASGFESDPGDTIIYKKCFTLPEDFKQEKVLLHFGAVDQIAEVTLNGVYLGEHRGGYLPFCFDITEAVKREGENELFVLATDTLSADLPYGKQRKKRGGMWYTPVSGIWGSVWIEDVPEHYIREIILEPDLKGVTISVEQSEGAKEGFLAEFPLDEKEEKVLTVFFDKNKGRLNFDDIAGEKVEPEFWTPDNPKLYRLFIRTEEDRVQTYFALREISIREAGGRKRVFLNGKPIFLHGLLDQGYFPEGIYTPKDFLEYERDVERAKDLGFNCLRKHIKIEPEHFYYACDRLGMLVIQDMVNSGVYSFFFDTFLPNFIFWRKTDRGKTNVDIHRKRIFIEHMVETMKTLRNHPCIIAYTIFNEGWGQFESDRLYGIAKETDPTRLIDSTSGWFAQHLSDFDSKHIYFHVIPLHPKKKRAMLLSECGGYTLEVKGHLFSRIKGIFGYGKCHDEEELTDAILHMYEVMVLPAIKGGLCGCIYTQLTDVEDELNGLYTYDRAVRKVLPAPMKALSKKIRYALSLAVGEEE